MKIFNQRSGFLLLFRSAAVLIFSVVLLAAIPGYTENENYLNLDESGIAVHGYDPVSYHMGAPEKGQEDYSVTHASATYLFASRENAERFRHDPQKYIPAFGGWCAWAMLDGEKVDIDPETYKIVNGQTYLYYNFFFVNTLKKWDALAEKETESKLVNKAMQQWQVLIN